MIKRISNPGFTVLILSWLLPAVSEAQSIADADGQPVQSEWCYEDSYHQITGIPSGGIFTGCGISGMNGRWYFNPALAGTGHLTFPRICRIQYTTPDGDTTSIAFTIHKPVVPMTGPDRAVCNGGSFMLSVDMLYKGEYSYHWTPSEYLTNPRAKETSGSVKDSQTFHVLVRDTLTGCQGDDAVTLWNASVHAGIEKEKPIACINDSFRIRSTTRDSLWTYHWDLGNGQFASTPDVNHVYNETGMYTIVLRVSNESCQDTVSHILEVSGFELHINAPERVDPGDPLALETYSTEPYQVISWEPYSLFNDQHAYTQTFRPDTTRTYQIKGESLHGCRDSVSAKVVVNPRTMMPGAFSPNGDGLNDHFRLITWGEPSVIKSFRIFDRWGKQVFNGLNKTAETGWDGTTDGRQAETGTYFYIIDYESAGRQTQLRGDITLIR